MSDLTKLTLKGAVDGLKSKAFSSEEITRAFLSNIEAANPTLNAYVEVTADKAIDMANNAVTVNGTRSKRLDLISSRLMDQVATFQELQSENEDVDLAEAGTMLAMARLTYEASLNATGKIMTQSLMDYI